MGINAIASAIVCFGVGSTFHVLFLLLGRINLDSQIPRDACNLKIHRCCKCSAVVQHPVMLTVDGKTVRRLLKKRFGKVAIPREFWPIPDSAPVDRTTLHRWFKGEVEPIADRFFAMAGALDVDPCALLLPPSSDSFVEGFRVFNEAPSLADLARETSTLIPLLKVLRANSTWPSDDFSNFYFRRSWLRNVLEHDAETKADYYGRFIIKFSEETSDRVIHFAWKGKRGRSWCPYGFVVTTPESINLYSYDGSACVAHRECDGDSITVETWFGRGSASFCIASLHPFQAKLCADGASAGPVVRFSIDA